MTAANSRRCPVCGQAIDPARQTCPHCGTPAPVIPERIALAGDRQLSLSGDTLSLRELLAIVEAGIAFWRRRFEDSEGLAREQAAASLRDLSLILSGLAQQIAQGRETVRITGRLPTQRRYPLACPLCGRGNRANARFCVSCGAALKPPWRPATPPRPLRADIAGRSHTGRVRPINEDSVYAGLFSRGDEPIGLLLLIADGMGGMAAGEVASHMAVETVKTALQVALANDVPASSDQWLAILRAAAQQANERIYAAAQADRQRSGMGTTLTVALASGRSVYLAHAGDSRAYLITPGTTDESPVWQQLTTDHTIVARLVDIGQLSPEAARAHPQRHMLYRSLGAGLQLDIDTRSQPLAPGDILLLCSDGLFTHVGDDEMAHIVARRDPALACADLIALANQRGGDDNISVAIARFYESPAP